MGHLNPQLPELRPNTTACIKCDDTGIVMVGAVVENGKVIDRGYAQSCECTIEKKIRSRLPKIYWDARISDFPDSVQATVAEWMSGKPKPWLRLYGDCGIGKTHLAAAIVRGLVSIRREVKFIRASEIYMDARERFSEGQTEKFLVKGLSEENCLVIDDIGAGNLSDLERRLTLEIIDRRVNELLPTVITTNWSLKDISEKMDDRIASRLSEFVGLKLEGKDKRVSRKEN